MANVKSSKNVTKMKASSESKKENHPPKKVSEDEEKEEAEAPLKKLGGEGDETTSTGNKADDATTETTTVTKTTNSNDGKSVASEEQQQNAGAEPENCDQDEMIEHDKTPINNPQKSIEAEETSSPKDNDANENQVDSKDANETDYAIIQSSEAVQVKVLDDETPTIVRTPAKEQQLQDPRLLMDSMENLLDGPLIDGDYKAMDDASDDEDEQWDLTQIISEEKITQQPILCGGGGSDSPCENQLAACLLYRTKDKKQRWFGCLDCQHTQFGGWPEKLEELPQTYITTKHRRAMVSHSSTIPEAQFFPDFLGHEPPSSTTVMTNSKDARVLTPVPSSQQASGGGKTSGKSMVTPSPHPNDETSKNGNKTKGLKKDPKTNKKYLEWQKDAEAAGAEKNVKIITNGDEAKEKVFQFLYDSFRPMNITDILTGMKKVIPAVVLSRVLKEMSGMHEQFDLCDVCDDSDDEDESKSKKKAKKECTEDGNVKSLCFKAGRTAGTSLYYVDYNKTKNNGNSDPLVCNDLAMKSSIAEAELSTLNAMLKNDTTEATKLDTEPTNPELTKLLADMEPAIEVLRETVADSQELKANEKKRKIIQGKIENMAKEWRKRQRLTLDFLNALEDVTDGTINGKKCLKGDGQIEMESDELVIGLAKEFIAKQRARGRFHNKKVGAKAIPSSTPGVIADLTFIGVTLSSQGTVKRKYYTEK